MRQRTSPDPGLHWIRGMPAVFHESLYAQIPGIIESDGRHPVAQRWMRHAAGRRLSASLSERLGKRTTLLGTESVRSVYEWGHLPAER